MSEQEISSLWEEYYPKVYGYFFKRVNNREDVEDLTSLTMTAFLNKMITDTPEKPHGYLWNTARFQLCGYIRKKSKIPVSYDIEYEEIEMVEAESSRSSALLERQQALLECVKKHAQERDYTIISRIIMDDAKAVDVAKEMDLRADLVRQRYRRVLQKLRKKCTYLWA